MGSYGGILVIWLLFGIVSAIVASNKGRSECGWFLLGVLLGPFGLILAFAVPKNQQVVEKKAVEEGSMKKCPYCAELIRAEAIKCRYCGADLDGDAPSDPSIGMALIVCPECGREISDAAISCPHCGYPLARKEMSRQDFQEEKKESPLKVLFVILLVLINFLLWGSILIPKWSPIKTVSVKTEISPAPTKPPLEVLSEKQSPAPSNSQSQSSPSTSTITGKPDLKTKKLSSQENTAEVTLPSYSILNFKGGSI